MTDLERVARAWYECAAEQDRREMGAVWQPWTAISESAREKFLERARAAIEAMGGGWQTIETAPKDGTRIIALHADFSGVVIIRWGIHDEHPQGGWLEQDWTGAFQTWAGWIPLPDGVPDVPEEDTP